MASGAVRRSIVLRLAGVRAAVKAGTGGRGLSLARVICRGAATGNIPHWARGAGQDVAPRHHPLPPQPRTRAPQTQRAHKGRAYGFTTVIHCPSSRRRLAPLFPRFPPFPLLSYHPTSPAHAPATAARGSSASSTTLGTATISAGRHPKP